MKKHICILLAIAMLIPATVLADVDLSGMTFDELVALREQLNLAIWNSQEWQEVTVPIGVWKIGEDIPVGKWTIRMAEDTTSSWASVVYCDRLDETGASGSSAGNVWNNFSLNPPDSKDNDCPTTIDIDCAEGMYIVNDRAPLVFTPYAGKPDLGFK